MDTLSEITSHIGATTTTTDPSEIWISDLTGLFHMMNFVFTKRNFFVAIDIFCVDLFMQSHTILLLEVGIRCSDLAFRKTRKNCVTRKSTKSRFTRFSIFSSQLEYKLR